MPNAYLITVLLKLAPAWCKLKVKMPVTNDMNSKILHFKTNDTDNIFNADLCLLAENMPLWRRVDVDDYRHVPSSWWRCCHVNRRQVNSCQQTRQWVNKYVFLQIWRDKLSKRGGLAKGLTFTWNGWPLNAARQKTKLNNDFSVSTLLESSSCSSIIS